MKRIPYDPPGLSLLGKIFEPLEEGSEELALRLTPRFFELPPDVREQALRAVVDRAVKRGGRREIALYDARDGRRIGTMSAESGLHLAR